MLPTPTFPIDNYDRPFYLAMLALLLARSRSCWLVRRSKLGLDAARDPRGRGEGARASASAYDRRQADRVVAHASWLTAMVGGVWAYYLTFIYPQFAVDPLVMIGMVLMIFLGGRGTLWGPTIGALVLVPAQQYMLTEARREPALPRRLRGASSWSCSCSCRAGSCRRSRERGRAAARAPADARGEPVVREEAHA